jgi:hypothetical protein
MCRVSVSTLQQIDRQARLSCEQGAGCDFYLHNEYEEGTKLLGTG